MGFKQHISRTWQMIEQQVNDVPFRPHNEAYRPVKILYIDTAKKGKHYILCLPRDVQLVLTAI